MTKIGVIGTGKTGSQVVSLLGEKAVLYNQKHPVTTESLATLDGAVVFVSPEGASEVLPALLQAKIPVAWGTTGTKLPEDLHEKVLQAETAWVVASNFSIGMVILKKIISQLGAMSSLLDEPVFSIREIHHTSKKDSPSGTARSWERWLGQDAAILSEREGDVVGIHELQVRARYESLMIRHEATDRSLFAGGAIRALEWLLTNNDLRGVFSLSALMNHVYQDGKIE